MRENKKKSRSKIKISKKGYVIPGACTDPQKLDLKI